MKQLKRLKLKRRKLLKCQKRKKIMQQFKNKQKSITFVYQSIKNYYYGNFKI